MIGIRFDLPFEEQLAFFRSKGLKISPEGWRQIWQAAHARAFTVASVTKMDVLRDIREALDDAMETGATLKEFKDGLRALLERKGWYAPEGEKAKAVMPDGSVRKRLAGWRLDTIYRTNLQAAYQVGRYRQMEEIKMERPYWRYHAVMDPSTRPGHAAQNGKIFHADHPFWDRWYPPNGFNCRCYVTTLSGRQMKRRGLTAQTRGVSEKPDEGFRYNPGRAGLDAWKPDMSKYPKELREKAGI